MFVNKSEFNGFRGNLKKFMVFKSICRGFKEILKDFKGFYWIFLNWKVL